MAGEASMENLNIDMENLSELDKLDMDPGELAEARKKLLEMLESEDLTDEMKENLKAMLSGNVPLFGGYGTAAGVLMAFGFAVLIFSIILFFGYKLYKSIKDKEKKKEEKKKAKQQKKKK